MHLVHIDNSRIDETPTPGDAEGFADLVERHHRDLLVYASALTRDPVTARDIVQEAFIVAYQKIGVFDVTRDFASWMRGIVRNKWREWLRKNRRYDLSDNEIARIDADISAWQTSRQQEENTMFDALEQCIGRLPETLVETVRCYYFEGLNGDEVSARLHISAAAVRKRLERARILLRQCLDRQLEKN